jgi:hypothetical protein
MTLPTCSPSLLGLLVLATVACSEPRATAEDCGVIFDRIVELELEEMGYRDPALAERRRNELRRTLASELQRCEGRRLAPTALACVREAKSAEQLTHDCLR